MTCQKRHKSREICPRLGVTKFSLGGDAEMGPLGPLKEVNKREIRKGNILGEGNGRDGSLAFLRNWDGVAGGEDEGSRRGGHRNQDPGDRPGAGTRLCKVLVGGVNRFGRNGNRLTRDWVRGGQPHSGHLCRIPCIWT